MEDKTPTRFKQVYDSFLSKITDDMYLQLTYEDTLNLLEELLFSAIHKFEFPRVSLDYEYTSWEEEDQNEEGSVLTQIVTGWTFKESLQLEEINIIATYMIVEWIGQQLASIENVRMKYSGSDFKFTSQANHMQKLLQMKKDYEREGFHLQRLYKRRKRDINGIYRSTMGQIVQPIDTYIFNE